MRAILHYKLPRMQATRNAKSFLQMLVAATTVATAMAATTLALLLLEAATMGLVEALATTLGLVAADLAVTL